MNPPRSSHRRYARISAAFIVAIFATLFGVAAGWVAAAPHPADPGPGETERIEFAAGTDSSTISGIFDEGSDDRYVLWAGAGQTMTVTSTEHVVVTVTGPGGAVPNAPADGRGFALPATGDYTLVVSRPSAEVTGYTLTVAIPATGDPGTSDPGATTTTSPPAGDAQRIEFAPGTDSTIVSGSLAPGANADYIFRAGAGQTVSVEVGPGEFLARTFIWGEGELANGGNSVSATLPETGDYVLGIDNTGTTTNFTVTVRIPAGTAPPTTGACGVDPQAPAITDNLAAVPPAQQVPGVPWTYLGESNYDPCADLSYAIVDIVGGTGSSPQHVMLFHRGDYIGTATECAFGFTSVASTTGDSVTVAYRWPREGDANAAPSGSAGATFSWNGTDVVTSGELPDELLTISGCDVGAPGNGDTPSDRDPAPVGTLPTTR